MDCLNNKPVFNYTQTNKSKVIYNNYYNCCLTSSFEINIRKIYPELPSLDVILKMFFPNTDNAYSHFALDFPEKWFILKNYLISKNIGNKEILEKVVLRFFVPIIQTKDEKECVLVSVIDINKINYQEVNKGNYDSLKDALTDEIEDGKISIEILQQENHFEPINIIKLIRDKSDSLDLNISNGFLN